MSNAELDWLARVLGEAEQLAAKLGHACFGVEHVLIALLELHPEHLGEALAPSGATCGAALASLRDLLGPAVPIRAPAVAGPSPGLRAALRRARTRLAHRGEAPSPSRLLREFLDKPSSPHAQALAELGLTPSSLAARGDFPGKSRI